MKVYPDKPTVYFDIDDTLVFSIVAHPNSQLERLMISGHEWLIHREQVNLLIDFAARGHTVVLWSAGGSDWAAMVAEALEIEKYVSLCIPKPFWYIDDKRVEEFMGHEKRSYIKPKHIV